jgi:hypothetical protein
MTSEKQGKAYGVLIFFVVVLLLAAQFGLQYMFKMSSEELVFVQSSLSNDQRQLDTQMTLSSRYDIFHELAQGQVGADRQFPVNGAVLFQALNSVMTDYHIDFVNAGSTVGVQPGATFTLQIRFSGQYYDLIKALAAIRESGFIMRLSELNVNAEGDGIVNGTMSIISTAAQG